MIPDTDTAQATQPKPRRTVLLIAVGVVVALALGVIAGMMFRPHIYTGTVIQSDLPAAPMTGLIYDNEESVDVAALQGDVVLVYFGFLYCPDLCPTMLASVNRALSEMGEDGEKVKMLMVTVDPERDDLDSLATYVRRFNPEFRGVWGETENVREVASQYGVFFDYTEPDDEGLYDVAHTASLFAIDPAGSLRLTFQPGVTASDLAADLTALLES